jgi:hypothetical protein
MTTMGDWIDAACAELGIQAEVADERLILDLARDVAHRVDRPAAPLTSFLLGVAVGGGQPLRPAAERLRALTAAWEGPVNSG